MMAEISFIWRGYGLSLKREEKKYMNNKHWIKNLFGAIAIPLLVAILLQGLCIIKGRTMIANMTSFDNFVVYIAIVMITTIALSINLNSGRFDFSLGSMATLSSVLGAKITYSVLDGGNYSALMMFVLTLLIGMLLENIDELCEKMKKYVVGSDMQSFYMCLCDKNELFADKSVCDHFTEKVSIPLAYQNGKFCSYDDFLSKEILPLEIREKSKRTFYTVTPIYYQHICYGYCVSDGSLFALKSELSYLWTVNIGMALENIRKWQWINRMNEKINRMWKYDMLTQVLNRSGFFYCAETILQKIKEEKSNAFIIFLDIDGLKSVNDNLGHEIGDAFIAKIAGILKEVVPKDCLIMRYGGDEFVVFGSCKQAGRMQRIAEDIKAAIKTADQKENRSYHLAASLGCSLHKSYEMDNLNSLIELADKKMYEEKKNKRR